MNNKIKLFGMMVLFLIGIVAVSGFASAALPINNILVTVEDRAICVDPLASGSCSSGFEVIPGLDKDNEIEVEVSFNALADIEEVQVEAVVRSTGHRDSVDDITDGFDTHNGSNYLKELTLKLPQRMENLRQYSLLVTISGRTNGGTEVYTATGTIDVSSKQHQVQIKDVVLSPENEVEAGRALLTTVRIKNRGEQPEEDVKVEVSIPALGISASDYIDELDAEGGDDDSTTSEELYIRIPENAESGDYTVKVKVTYDDGDEKEEATTTIKIISSEEGEAAAPAETTKTIITAGPSIQDVARGGAGVVYPVTISNAGANAKTYTISADGADWAEFRISPTNVVTIAPGESKAIYVYLSAKDTATAGENSFAVTIKSGETVLKEVALKANVTAAATSSWSKIKRALEIGLVVLVVLLVILGLIIGFNKLKGSEEEGEGKEDSQTYY